MVTFYFLKLLVNLNANIDSGLQSVMGLALDFAWNGALQEKFNFYFQDFFARIDKIFILAAGLRVSFYGV